MSKTTAPRQNAQDAAGKPPAANVSQADRPRTLPILITYADGTTEVWEVPDPRDHICRIYNDGTRAGVASVPAMAEGGEPC